MSLTKINDPLIRCVLGDIVDTIENALVDQAHSKNQTPEARKVSMLIKEVGLIATRAIRSGDTEEVSATVSALTSAMSMIAAFYCSKKDHPIMIAELGREIVKQADDLQRVMLPEQSDG